MKKLWKRTAALLSLGAFCTSMATGVPVGAEAQSEFGTGLIFEEENGVMPLVDDYIFLDPEIAQVVPLSKVDLSTSSYFPQIGNQGSLNSCAIFASTYYQFTYEAHKLNQITTTPANTYSPTWTYNLLNKGTNRETNISHSYDALSVHGALTLEDCPYNPSNYSFAWSTNTDAMIEALDTKLESYTTLNVAATETDKIDSVSDPLLTQIKQCLTYGKVLAVSVKAANVTESGNSLTNWSTARASNGEWAVYRASTATSGHAMTIVGYDDTIYYDVNGNGTIEASERGAFKLANSYGTGWGNQGYIWVMYDALNVVSANTTNSWENNESGKRIPIFLNSSGGNNAYHYVNVKNHDVNLIGLLTFTTPNRYLMQLHTGRSATTTFNTSTSFKALANLYSGNSAPFQGTLVLDYDTLDDDIENYLSGYKWFIRIWNREGSGNITNVSYKIVDNKNNIVHNFGQIASYITPATYMNDAFSKYVSLNLQIGDVDYSKTLTETDATMILNFAVSIEDASDLQKKLADYNRDSSVDARDVAALRVNLSASEAAAFDATITEMYHQIQSNAQVMTADLSDAETERYIEIVTELYFEFVQEG